MTKISLLPQDTGPVGSDVIAGVETSIDTTEKFALSDILTYIKNNLTGSITFADLFSTIFSGQLQSGANSGSAGGTNYWLNLGGFKIFWCVTAEQTFAAGYNSYGVNFPGSFFTANPAGMAGEMGTATGQTNQGLAVQNITTNSCSIEVYSPVSGESSQIFALLIGT